MKKYIKTAQIISSLTPQEKQIIRNIFDECGIAYTESVDQSTVADVKYNELVILEEPRTSNRSRDYEMLKDKLIELELSYNICDDGFGREHIFYKCI